MKTNPEKCHLLMNVNTPATIKVGEHSVTNSYCEKSHGGKTDSQLNFNIIFKRLLKKPLKMYMLWLELRLVCVFQKDLQAVSEMFKVRKTMSAELIQGLLGVRKTRYRLKNSHNFDILSKNSVYHGSGNISDLECRTWKLVPDRLKELKCISSFKNRIKRWQPEICPCRPCKTYIPRVGFYYSPKSNVT